MSHYCRGGPGPGGGGGGPMMRGGGGPHRPRFDFEPRFREMAPPRMFRGPPPRGPFRGGGNSVSERMMMMRGGPGPGGPGFHHRQPPPIRRGPPSGAAVRMPTPVIGQQQQQQGMGEEDLWAETDTGDGKCYYYHTRTRDTTWDKPEGPNVRIVKHEEVSP